MVAVVDVDREVRMKLFVIEFIVMMVFFCCASLGSVEISGMQEIEYKQPKDLVLVSDSDVIYLLLKQFDDQSTIVELLKMTEDDGYTALHLA